MHERWNQPRPRLDYHLSKSNRRNGNHAGYCVSPQRERFVLDRSGSGWSGTLARRYTRGPFGVEAKKGGERPHKRLSKSDPFRTARAAGYRRA